MRLRHPRIAAIFLTALSILAGACSLVDREVPPVANQDHWQVGYGVWSCNADDGAGAWLPHFSSSDDQVGIHSHDDGLISIHPWSDESAGRRAVADHFFASMRAELTDDRLVLDDGSVLSEDDDCPGGEPVLHIRRWPGPDHLDEDPQITTKNLANERFRQNGEMWAFVHAPLDAVLDPFPADRLQLMKNWGH